MAIAVECPNCGKQLKVKDELAGRKGKCPQCQKTIQIPAAAEVAVGAGQAAPKSTANSAAAEPRYAAQNAATQAAPKASAVAAARPAAAPLSAEQIREKVLAAFEGKMEPPKVGIVRKFGSLIVLAILAVMPIFYFAVIGALGFGMYWLATTTLIPWPHPAAQAAAIGTAGLFLLCLIKPLIEPQRRGEQVYPVDLAKERLLGDLTAKICEQIDAPQPKTIQFECSPRLAVTKGGEVLTLGLPVMASLSVEQFVGVVADLQALHRRKAGCRIVNMIRGINYWLWRSVYGKSRFDRWLSLVAQRRHFHFAKLLLPLMLTKIPVQAVLFIPMFIANTIAQGVVRAAEFDADRAATRLVGKKTFAAIVERLDLINFTWDGVLNDLKFLHKEQQLPESVPNQVALQMQDMTAELCAALRDTVNAPDDKPFDTKPSAPDRLEAVQKEAMDGVFRCPLPAKSLLADYDGLSRRMTADFYAARFGKQAAAAE